MQNFSGSGMLDRQEVCVKSLPPQGVEGGPGGRPKLIGLGFEMRAVDAVTHQGVTDISEVHPDLMGAAGLELAGEEGGDRFAVVAMEGFLHRPVGDRLAAIPAHGHFLAGIRVAVDRGVYGAARRIRMTLHHRVVPLVDSAFLERQEEIY